MQRSFLGGLTPQQFLDRHWQKRPLLVRGALPDFAGILTRNQVFDLAADPDVESRLVAHIDGAWTLEHGPFRPTQLRRRRNHPWTVLVQGVNLLVPAGDALMRTVDFVPWARLDDLMVSYAVDGGGVGPHFDSYDVFLIQGTGKRRWRIGAQRDLDLIEGAPLKILKRFRPTREWVLEPGDMLYLPPHYAHDGVALGECTTYSIGFRAPSAQEIASEFLTYLQDRIELPGMYRDPGLRAPRNRGEIANDMVHQVEAMIGRVSCSRRAIEDFLGCYLSEPKPQVFFSPPAKPLSQVRFAQAARARGIALDSRTQLLFRGRRFYINGERTQVSRAAIAPLRRLADARALAAGDLGASVLPLLHEWYRCGFCHPLPATRRSR